MVGGAKRRPHPTIMKTDDELKQNKPKLYAVARTCGTEAPFSSEYVHPGKDGMFHCAICDAPLFSSDTQFDSGSGWPSFTQPVKLSPAYVYVLRMSNGQLYTGSTTNLTRRIKHHKEGKVFTTKKYLPISLIHYETYDTESEARERERNLKHHGSAFAKLKNEIKDNNEISLAGFTDPAFKDAVTLVEDNSHGMHRTEVRCAKCDAHLGHVFPDGPKREDGKNSNRFCINGVSLDLKAK